MAIEMEKESCANIAFKLIDSSLKHSLCLQEKGREENASEEDLRTPSLAGMKI